jgi:putative DNA primase/helicase
VIAQGKAEEGTEKRLGALLLTAEGVIAIANWEAPLGSEFPCKLPIQRAARTRVPGRSEPPELPSNAFVSAAESNLGLIGDVTRQALCCHFDPRCERPELRRFDRNPVAAAKADRGRYVAAALTVLRAFHSAGRPRQSDPLGSFEAWSSWACDALLCLDEADPVSRRRSGSGRSTRGLRPSAPCSRSGAR